MKVLKGFATQLKERVKTKCSVWSARKGFPDKIERLNHYANNNKKRTLSFAFGTTFFFFLISVALLVKECNSPKDDFLEPLSQIEDISPIITKKQQIDAVKQSHIEEERSILIQGKRLKEELDSLISLPRKTHRDSLEIVRKHKQLELIVKYINEKD